MLADFTRPFRFSYASGNKHKDAAVLMQLSEVQNQCNADKGFSTAWVTHYEKAFSLRADQKADFLVTSEFFPDWRFDWKPIMFVLDLTICQILPCSIVLQFAIEELGEDAFGEHVFLSRYYR